MNEDRKQRVCIVGAGLSGLVCGMKLSGMGFQVTIVEELTRSGGLLACTRVGKEYLELLPHHIRKTDKNLLNLIKEVGVDDHLEWCDSLWQGRAAKRKIGYFTDGFNSLIGALVQEITDNGGIISYSTTVSDIEELKDSDFRFCTTCIFSNSQKTEIYSDYVVFTGSCRAFARVSHGLPLELDLRDELMNISYQSSISVMFITKKQFSEVYFRPTGSEVPFDRIINHSSCFGTRNYGGNVVYLVGNLPVTDPLWIATDSEIFDHYYAAFRKLYTGVRKSDIRSWRVTKSRYAVPDRKPLFDLTEPMNGIYLCTAGINAPSSSGPVENHMDDVIGLASKIANSIVLERETPYVR